MGVGWGEGGEGVAALVLRDVVSEPNPSSRSNTTNKGKSFGRVVGQIMEKKGVGRPHWLGFFLVASWVCGGGVGGGFKGQVRQQRDARANFPKMDSKEVEGHHGGSGVS